MLEQPDGSYEKQLREVINHASDTLAKSAFGMTRGPAPAFVASLIHLVKKCTQYINDDDQDQLIRGLMLELAKPLDEEKRARIFSRLRDTLTEFDAPTKGEMEVLIKVREAELQRKLPTSEVLVYELGMRKEQSSADVTVQEAKTLQKRIERLDKSIYGPYLRLNTHLQTKYYSTIHNAMIRHPATAIMARIFDVDEGAGAVTLESLATYGEKRDIGNASYYYSTLLNLGYFEQRGEGFIGPARRLSLEKEYIEHLAQKWPVQSDADLAEIKRMKNEILWCIWEREHRTWMDIPEALTTEEIIVRCATRDCTHTRAQDLARHALYGLVSSGLLKATPEDSRTVYFLNERMDSNNEVVTWPSTALIFRAIDKAQERAEPHSMSVEEVYLLGLQSGLSIDRINEALRFGENARYVSVHREGGRPVRVWRTERLRAERAYIAKLAAQPLHITGQPQRGRSQ